MTAGLVRRRIGLPETALLVVAWWVAVELAWALLHPDLAAIRAAGNDLWMDGHAYWMAWRHGSLYGLPPRALDAYLYSPAFAQAIWPLTVLPWPAFAALWWGAIVGAFAWLLWPLPWYWRVPALVATGVEVELGNVNAFLALMLVLALRWPACWAFGLLTKGAPGIGLLWHVVRREWRAVGVAVGTTLGIVAVSVAFAPGLWLDWLAFLRHSGGGGSGGLSTVTLPVRLLGAVLLIAWGARRDKPWVLPVATAVVTPLWGTASLTILAALPRIIRASGTYSRRSS